MEKPTRKPPIDKRHTKPCKFFQTASCPYTAEECDFAHIIAVRPSPTVRNAKPCRYFRAGNCANGLWCRYSHQISIPNSSSPLEYKESFEHPLDDMYSPISPYPAVYLPPSFWPPASHPIHYDILSRPFFFPIESPPPSESGDGNTSVSEATGSVFSEDSAMEQSSIGEVEGPELSKDSSHCPALIIPTVSPMCTPPATAVRSRSKAQCYKTKPCKFYNPEFNRSCPKGDRCTFIHDSPSAPRFDEHGLPAKPLSAVEESKKRGFYPITWRVIGGGVMVGNPDKIDNLTVKVDFPTEQKENISPVKATPRPRSLSMSSTPSPIQVNAESLFPAESPGGL